MRKYLFLIIFCVAITGYVYAANDNEHFTIENRINCQKVIEHVYYQHRIWPKENTGQKPSFESLMPKEVLVEKVIDTLEKTKALEYYWHYTISGEDLQAEINRR